MKWISLLVTSWQPWPPADGWLLQTLNRISDTYVLGSVFLPEPEQTDLGREDSGSSERRRARCPKSHRQQALFLRSSQNADFSPKLSHTEKKKKPRRGAKIQTFLEELSFQNFRLVPRACVFPLSLSSLHSHPTPSTESVGEGEQKIPQTGISEPSLRPLELAVIAVML